MTILDCKMRRVPMIDMYHALINSWELDGTVHAELDNYFTLYWTGSHLAHQNSNGTIIKDGERYNIVYRSCSVGAAYTAKQVQLSFRKPKKHYNLPGFVLVRVVQS